MCSAGRRHEDEYNNLEVHKGSFIVKPYLVTVYDDDFWEQRKMTGWVSRIVCMSVNGEIDM